MDETTAERVTRIRLWVKGYRSLMNHLSPDIHTAHTEVSRIDDDTFAHLSIDDVEWLLEEFNGRD